jgi:3-hydroxyisobutyrate dehydrogenase
MTNASEPVAVIGVGTMGHGMAASALRAGIATIVWDRAPEATRDLAELGADVAQSAADAARRASIVVTMVPDADAVLATARDEGMLSALAPARSVQMARSAWRVSTVAALLGSVPTSRSSRSSRAAGPAAR